MTVKGHSINFGKQKFNEREFTLLSKTYINAHKKLKYKCDKGHISWINYNKLSVGRGCPNCKALNILGNTYGKIHGKSHTKEYKQDYWKKVNKNFLGNQYLIIWNKDTLIQ